jgi:hypothetical protein
MAKLEVRQCARTIRVLYPTQTEDDIQAGRNLRDLAQEQGLFDDLPEHCVVVIVGYFDARVDTRRDAALAEGGTL